MSARTGKRTAAVKVGSTPYDATFAYGAAWATANGSGDVERIDPGSQPRRQALPAPGRVGVVGAFGSIWAAGPSGVIRIDPGDEHDRRDDPVAVGRLDGGVGRTRSG